MVVHQLPLTATGWNTSGLTQKIVDAYYMNDGSNCPGMNSEYANVPEYNNNHRLDTRPRATGFTTTAEEHKPLAAGVSLQYADREPRFYASVAYNGAYWYLGNEKEIADRNKQIFYYRGKRDGYTASTAARKRATGSYARNAANCWNMHTCACPAVRSAKRRTLADSAPFIATSPK